METPVTAVEKQEFFDKFVKGRLVGVDSPAFKASRCLYTYNPPWPDSKSDLNFIVDCHPDSEKAIVISACSGHGFKHSPAIGEKVANYILHGTGLPREFKILINQIAEIGL